MKVASIKDSLILYSFMFWVIGRLFVWFSSVLLHQIIYCCRDSFDKFDIIALNCIKVMRNTINTKILCNSSNVADKIGSWPVVSCKLFFHHNDRKNALMAKFLFIVNVHSSTYSNKSSLNLKSISTIHSFIVCFIECSELLHTNYVCTLVNYQIFIGFVRGSN